MEREKSNLNFIRYRLSNLIPSVRFCCLHFNSPPRHFSLASWLFFVPAAVGLVTPLLFVNRRQETIIVISSGFVHNWWFSLQIVVFFSVRCCIIYDLSIYSRFCGMYTEFFPLMRISNCIPFCYTSDKFVRHEISHIVFLAILELFKFILMLVKGVVYGLLDFLNAFTSTAFFRVNRIVVSLEMLPMLLSEQPPLVGRVEHEEV